MNINIVSTSLVNTVELDIKGYKFNRLVNEDYDDFELLNSTLNLKIDDNNYCFYGLDLMTHSVKRCCMHYLKNKTIVLQVGYDIESGTVVNLELHDRKVTLVIERESDKNNNFKIECDFDVEYFQREKLIKFLFATLEKYPNRTNTQKISDEEKVILTKFEQLKSDLSIYL